MTEVLAYTTEVTAIALPVTGIGSHLQSMSDHHDNKQEK